MKFTNEILKTFKSLCFWVHFLYGAKLQSNSITTIFYFAYLILLNVEILSDFDSHKELKNSDQADSTVQR